MLALLLAPRGRISAARMAAQARLRRQVEARRTVIRVPEVAAARACASTTAEVRDADQKV
ncbi:MAG TPA: hypothetical protein VGX50_08435 [Longimicrobium sp.]|jgi:hypothetical protein|nr:hypothetical protein [Longimicrobium sp.]